MTNFFFGMGMSRLTDKTLFDVLKGSHFAIGVRHFAFHDILDMTVITTTKVTSF